MRTVRRALSVLDCFSPASARLTLQEIADRLGLAKSTTFRAVNALEDLGYLVRLTDQRYCLSLQFTRLGALARDTVGIREIARPAMEQLARTSRESVTVFTIEGSEYICVDVCSPPAPVMGLNRPGQRGPLNLGAASLVLMAYLPEPALIRILPAVARRMRHSQCDLRSILANVRKQQYAVSHGGAIPGLSALSVPLFGADDAVRYSLNIVMPTARARGRIVPLLRLLRKVGRKVSLGLGASVRGCVHETSDT
ncbi:MAG TPA: IclR family transcriptional regulator [Burkholderiales bacterium]|nr:IclR family transcriptional regulator [Burkholderiales bacterium]